MSLKTRSKQYAVVTMLNQKMPSTDKPQSLELSTLNVNDIERAYYEGGMWVIGQLEPALLYNGSDDRNIVRHIKEIIKSLKHDKG